ncbi:MAG: S8 family serine peptidase [Candidatus Poseidoniaceae archaeon]
MRATLMLVLLLGAGLGPMAVPEGEPGLAVLEIEEGVWTQAAWTELSADGWDLLRLASWSQAVVWHDGWTEAPSGFQLMPAETPDVSGLALGQGVRLVFEPRLPLDAISRLIDAGGPAEVEPHLRSTQTITTTFHPAQQHWPGVQRIEHVLPTEARNDRGAGLLQSGDQGMVPLWSLGLNGSGVVLATADSGLDLDHTCFRNGTTEVGVPGPDHRKILVLNTTVHDTDAPGHDDYRHGTHTAGTLGCEPVDWNRSQAPGQGVSLAHGSTLVVADIVDASGWAPPSFDALLSEAALHGAVVHAHSWGDATTEYTSRSETLDRWSLEHPWTLAFIAPGNGGQVLEPANALNAVAVGATTVGTPDERWVGSPDGPTVLDTDGIGLLAPGSHIVSAKADGDPESLNGEWRGSSGTSMATPMAAAAAGVVQQMIQDGWIHGGSSSEARLNLTATAPGWASPEMTGLAWVADGWTPSGPMLRATLALSAEPLPAEHANDGAGPAGLSNPHDGWGQPRLERLLAPSLVDGAWDPAPHVVLHDAYRLLNTTPQQMLQDRLSGVNSTAHLGEAPWDGAGAVGPFLAEGDRYVRTFDLRPGSDLDVRLAYPSLGGQAVDDLVLRVHLDDGRSATSGVDFAGFSVISDNVTSPQRSNETLRGIRIAGEDLHNVTSVTVEVVARHVVPGNLLGHLGTDGDRLGFALAVMGVERAPPGPQDQDADGVLDDVDVCLNVPGGPVDADADGCPDDRDEDGVNDADDACPDEDARPADADLDGCLDDGDGDGVPNHIDACPNTEPDLAWPTKADGCRPVDVVPVLEATLLRPELRPDEEIEVVVSVVDDDGDGGRLTASLVIDGIPLAASLRQVNGTGSHRMVWNASLWATPWVSNGSMIEVVLTFETWNASPEAAVGVVMPEVPVRAVVFDPPPVEATAETNPSFRPVANAVLLMLLIVALIRIRGAPERKTAEVRDPFVDTSRRDFEAE